MLHAPYCSDGLNARETRAEERGGAILQSSAISDDEKTTSMWFSYTLVYGLSPPTHFLDLPAGNSAAQE